MAIPYAGVHRKLKDADTPWEKKVGLARFAWVSPRCFLPNKEQVLMDWAANSLANAHKLSVPDLAVPRLWQFLLDALRSQRLKTMGSRAEALSLRLSLFPVILKSLCIGTANVELVIGCCHSLLEYPSLGSIITGTLDHQVQFLSTVVCLLTDFLRTRCGRTPVLLNSLVQRAFASFASLQRQQPNPRKVFTIVYEKLLGPLLALHHTISDLNEVMDESFSDTLKCIQDLIASGLFNRDLAEGHSKYLRSVPGQVTTEKQREVRLLQESISALWKNMAERTSNIDEVNVSLCYIAGMPVVFRAFLSLHKYPNDVSFAMLRKLCCAMGLMPAQEHDGKAMTGVENQQTSVAEKPLLQIPEQKSVLGNWTAGLPALSKLLKVLSEKQIYEVASDNMSGKTQFSWLHDLIGGLISNADSSQSAWYASLSTALDMNHLLLEDQLTPILKEALYCSDKACLTQNTQRERDEFLKKLLGTYTKLRQFDRVVSAMLELCKSASADGEHFAYPTQFCTSFSESVQQLPPGLTLDIWKQFLDQFLTRYLPEGTQNATTLPSPPPRKKSKPGSNKRSTIDLTVIAVTFDLFLRSMRLVDGSLMTVPLLRRVEELMTETKDGVLAPLLHLCSESEPSVGQVYSTLLLCYVWGELHLLLCQHTNYRDRHPFSNSEETVLNFGDFSFVHTYGTSNEWSRLCTMFAEKERIQLLQVSLAVQQIRALLLFGEITSDVVRQSLVNIATAVCDKATKNRDSSGKSLVSILLDNIPFLLPFLPAHQITTLASLLCKTLMSSHTDLKSSGSLQNQKQVQPDSHSDKCGDASVHRICEEFVRSEFCVESRQLQIALVTSVLGQMSEVMGSLSAGSNADTLHSLSDTDVKCTSDGDSNTMKLQEIALDVNKLLAGAEMVKPASHVSPDVYRSVEGVLKVLHHLPLQHLLPSNKARCMLGLLVVDTALNSISPKNAPGAPYFSALLLCRQLQAAILRSVGSSKAKFLSNIDAWRILTVMTKASVDAKQKVTKKTVVDLDSSLNDVTEELLTYWLKRLRQLPNQEAGFKDYSHMVESKLDELDRHLSRSKNAQLILSANVPLLTAATALLGSLFVSRGALGSLGSELSCDLGRRITEALSSLMRHGQGASACPRLLIWLAKAGTLLMKFALRTVRTDSENRISTVKSDAELDSDEADVMETNLSTVSVATEQWTEVLNPVLQEICTYFEPTGEKSCPVIGPCLTYMQTSCLFIGRCCDVGTIGMATSDMWQAALSLMGTGVHLDESVMNDLTSTLSGIIQTMDLVQFRTLLTDLLRDTALKREPDAEDCPHLRAALVAWQLLPTSCAASEEIQGVLGDVIPQVILNLLEILKGAASNWTLGGAVAVSVLQAVSSIIGQGKSLVAPNEAMQAQHFGLMVPVAMVTAADFPLVFNTLCQILRSLLIGYPRTVMKSLASFFACLQHLLKAVMHRGQQSRDGDEKLSDHDLYICAENMERLLTMLATYKKDINKLAVFLVSDYIAELQKGTLLPLFKKALVTGIYNLLDACDERAIDFLNATLPNNLREIFKTFYSDFQKYYRYSGKV
ncbi:unhealthy ribosome biogenesis protein 2 homolog isoform X2 [Patiria miniata]|uniref:Nucleolar 27S pre-rRNA processing Urb2/Npa2 C-terminal domain-containing protein n=1 Tax=Patiria miniata TaxID=46514 RepID=A0A914APE2_PATMI|nr:unhealthy ribosome biogenesis protein 2 homolog isoform X2 [Patiria miniata]